MNHRARLFLGAVIGLLILMATAFLIWGNTWRMSMANRDYNKADYDRARERYEDLLVDLPNSPYVFNNLGLALLKSGQSDKAVNNLKEATGGLEGLKVGKFRKGKLKNEFYYNLGYALYDSAEKSQDQRSQGNYQAALDSFKQAIEADPKDLNAKYNYELTLLKLQQPPPDNSEQKQNEAQNIINNNDAQYFVPQIKDEEPVAKDW
ncbi:MAG: tetratricopeptide repeat protein [Bacteroidota bacterium]